MNTIRFILSSFLLLVLWSSLSEVAQFGDYTADAANDMVSPTMLLNIKQIDAGGSHTCVLTNTGGVKCWGSNEFGQLGDGTFETSSSPVDVVGLDGRVVAISAGALHSCALTELGRVKCWGQNYDGQLGDGSTDVSNTPIDVVDLKDKVAAISAGFLHTCALLIDTTVSCWGANHNDQLGNFKTGNNSTTPVQVLNMNQAMNRVIAVATGASHTCVLTNSGGVQCWGANTDGQLGTNDTRNTNRPLGVYGLDKDVIAISTGSLHTCALLITGAVKCWGDNSLGQLATNTSKNALKPVDIENLNIKATALSTGGGHSCVVSTVGGVLCWGDNSAGQLGNNSTANSAMPVKVYELDNEVTTVAAGKTHTCVLTKAGAVKCWGRNDSGQLGNGHIANNNSPRVVQKLRRDVVDVSSGSAHTCVVASTGEVLCWGRNDYGQLGDGSTNNRQRPTSVTELEIGIVAVSAGDSHTCALTDNSGVKCWGRNDLGQLGAGSDIESSSKPVDVSGLESGVIAISAGFTHSCALLNNGNVKCWGWNRSGQLGNNDIVGISNVPVDVVGLNDNVMAISAGATHTCALTDHGSVKCWGNNVYSQLGNTNSTNSSSPVAVPGLDYGVSALAVGSFHTCVITTPKTIKCWGLGNYGELGNSNADNISATPVDVNDLNREVTAISLGNFYTCALTSRGGVKCWGRGIAEQQSVYNEVDSSIPVDIKGLRIGVTAISAGGSHVCALTNAGVKCWGDNTFGQLGDGKAWFTTPIDVVGP